MLNTLKWQTIAIIALFYSSMKSGVGCGFVCRERKNGIYAFHTIAYAIFIFIQFSLFPFVEEISLSIASILTIYTLHPFSLIFSSWLYFILLQHWRIVKRINHLTMMTSINEIKCSRLKCSRHLSRLTQYNSNESKRSERI